MGFIEFISKMFGNKASRDMREIQPWVQKIKDAYPAIAELSNDELRTRTVALKEKIKNYGIEDYVILLGRQFDPKPYYEEADIYIHPADKEGFGITVAEAMSSGLPVIVSNKGGVPELVKNYEDGIIVDAYNPEEWANAIINLHNDRELYNKLSKNGFATYNARFTPETYAKNLDLIYDTIMSV